MIATCGVPGTATDFGYVVVKDTKFAFDIGDAAPGTDECAAIGGVLVDGNGGGVFFAPEDRFEAKVDS